MVVISIVLAIQLAITITVLKSDIEMVGKVILMAYPILTCLFLYVWRMKGNDNVLGPLSGHMVFQIIIVGLFKRQAKKNKAGIV